MQLLGRWWESLPSSSGMQLIYLRGDGWLAGCQNIPLRGTTLSCCKGDGGLQQGAKHSGAAPEWAYWIAGKGWLDTTDLTISDPDMRSE
jgi:hypothetical protein